MSTETWSAIQNEFAFAWIDGKVRRSRYALSSGNVITSVRGKANRGSPRPINEMTLTKTSYSYTPGKYVSLYDGHVVSGKSLALFGLVDRYSGAPPIWPSHTSSTGAAAAIAVQQAYKEASEPYFREVHQMGELWETIQALKSPMAGLRKLNGTLATITKANKKNIGRAIKDASGAYLEHIYGTAPLLGTAATYGQLAGRILDRTFPSLKIARGFSKLDHDGTEKGSWVAYIDGISRPVWDNCHLYYEIEAKTSERAGAGIVVRNPRLRNSTTSFASLAHEGWELLPLSFLLNMFVDLSSLLGECRPVAGEMVGSWVTTVVNAQAKFSLKSVQGYATDEEASVVISKDSITRRTDVTRTGKLHLGPGLNSFGKIISTLALGISRTK